MKEVGTRERRFPAYSVALTKLARLIEERLEIIVHGPNCHPQQAH